VVRSTHHEYGKAELHFHEEHGHTSPLFEGCHDGTVVWMSHSDRVETLPEGFKPIAYSDNSPYAAIADESRRIYALQFHPEVHHSEEGHIMLRNFARKICGVEEKWDMGHFLKEQIKKIRAQVGDGKVLCALSGGVDSSVVAALLYEAIGDQLIPFLAQGTLYPDVIESVSVKGPSETIKSHHNVGGLPDWMDFELIEPLRELFKDEVRRLGLELGLPESLVYRHPFPGPGLAIRIMGEVNIYDLDILREADVILLEELKASGYYNKTWQVMGDNRTYDNTVCIRVVEAVDGMTATFAHLPHDLLERISRRIINEVDGINRVVYDISSKPPATIEWE